MLLSRMVVELAGRLIWNPATASQLYRPDNLPFSQFRAVPCYRKQWAHICTSGDTIETHNYKCKPCNTLVVAMSCEHLLSFTLLGRGCSSCHYVGWQP